MSADTIEKTPEVVEPETNIQTVKQDFYISPRRLRINPNIPPISQDIIDQDTLWFDGERIIHPTPLVP